MPSTKKSDTKKSKNKSRRRPGGRPKFKESYIKDAVKLTELGMPEKFIADFLGVNRSTYWRWKKTRPKLRDAVKKSSARCKERLLKAMIANVEKGQPAVQIFLSKNLLGFTDRQDFKVAGEVNIKYQSHIPQEKTPPLDKTSSKKYPHKGADSTGGGVA